MYFQVRPTWPKKTGMFDSLLRGPCDPAALHNYTQLYFLVCSAFSFTCCSIDEKTSGFTRDCELFTRTGLNEQHRWAGFLDPVKMHDFHTFPGLLSGSHSRAYSFPARGLIAPLRPPAGKISTPPKATLCVPLNSCHIRE